VVGIFDKSSQENGGAEIKNLIFSIYC